MIRPCQRPVDLDAEAARLAEERKDPPGRVWGVFHPHTSPQVVTVQVDGHPFQGRARADMERREFDERCQWCESRVHSLVWRDTPGWVSE